MTELSPAAQAVLDAAARSEPGIYETIIAALEALADQVVPERDEPSYGECDYEICDVVIHLDQQRIRSEILAIAAELKQ